MPIIANNKYYIIKANGKYYDIYNPFKTFTFTIVPTPSDATVILTATGYTQVGNSITIRRGTTVSWSVSKGGYVTQSGSQIVNADETKNIILVQNILYKCYSAYNQSIGLNVHYYVYKTQSVGDRIVYCYNNDVAVYASDSSQLKQLTAWEITSLNENSMTMRDLFFGEILNLSRDWDHDLYT